MQFFAYVDPESGLELHEKQCNSGRYTPVDVPDELFARFEDARMELAVVEGEIRELVSAAEWDAVDQYLGQ